MLVEVDVSESVNCPMSLGRVFYALGEPAPVSRVMASDPGYAERLCDVTGWSAAGPCPAQAVLVEDSGEGIVLLVYGGDEGIRLKLAGGEEAGDLDSPSQWGEPCLLLDQDASQD